MDVKKKILGLFFHHRDAEFIKLRRKTPFPLCLYGRKPRLIILMSIVGVWSFSDGRQILNANMTDLIDD